MTIRRKIFNEFLKTLHTDKDKDYGSTNYKVKKKKKIFFVQKKMHVHAITFTQGHMAVLAGISLHNELRNINLVTKDTTKATTTVGIVVTEKCPQEAST